MDTDICQRWRNRRALYRLAREPIDTSAYEVAPIDGRGADTIARDFVEKHHYSGTMVAARERIGLYRARGAWALGDGDLVGVAVFSVPMQAKVLDVLPCDREAAVELGRFVLLDQVEANAETWFLARAFEILKARGYEGVVSFSDPVPRRAADGRVVFRGHLGTIYRASNAVFAGLSTARTLKLLPDGSVLNDRALQKIRARESGWRYAVDQLVAAGASPPQTADLRLWLRSELPRLVRHLRHGGNLRYTFGLTKRVKRRLPPSLPYPRVSPLLHSPEASVMK